MTGTVAALGAGLLSLILVGIVRQYALRGALLDHANERSSHVGSVPRGGGLGLVLAFVAAWLYLAEPINPALGLVLAGLVVVGLAGWIDDHGGLSVRIRLAAHVLGGLSVLPWALASAALPGWIGPLAALVWIFWTVSTINVVNFIDGIDGIIGIQAAVFGGACILLGDPGGRAAQFGMILLATSAGFLFWNLPKARIFLGDVGSGTLGLLFVIGGVLLLLEGRVSFVQAWLPLYPIFLDAAVTLFRRIRRGARITEAHREHFYQRLARGRSHLAVAAGYGVASLLGVAAVAVGAPTAAAVYFLGVAVVGFAWDRRIVFI